MRKQTRWLKRSKKIAYLPRGDGRWKHDRRHIHMIEKSDAVSEYLVSFGVAMLSAIKLQMISGRCDLSRGTAFCRSSATGR